MSIHIDWRNLMTTTIIATNTIVALTAFSFAAVGDALAALPNVTPGSTGGTAINFAFADVEVSAMGTLASVSPVQISFNSSFSITGTGTFVSLQSASGNAALFAPGGSVTIQVDGTLISQASVGILTNLGNNVVAVPGSVTGGSAGVWLGLTGAANDVLVNLGSIRAGAHGDGILGTRFNNGVSTEGANTRITNLEGSTITAVSSFGAGVRLETFGNGSSVSNAGTITSVLCNGMDFDGLGWLKPAGCSTPG